MKKLLSIFLLFGLAAGVYYLYFSETFSPKVNDKNFVLNDTENVTQIALEDRERNKVVLTKKEGIWYVNNKFKAFAPQVDLFLKETISKIRVKGPVPKTAQKTTIRKMVGKAIHVKIYEKDEIVRDYYVGPANPAQDASYLHINGSEVPYLAHILGHNSILYPKFSISQSDWLDRTVFDYEPSDIEKIEVNYTTEPNESFTLSRKDSIYILSPSARSVNQVAAKSYFSLFSFKNFEGYAEYLKQSTKDSLKESSPFIQIKVTLTTGKSRTLNLHEKKQGEGNTLFDKSGNQLVEDTERYFATFTGFPYLVTVQDYVFGKLLVKRSYWEK